MYAYYDYYYDLVWADYYWYYDGAYHHYIRYDGYNWE